MEVVRFTLLGLGAGGVYLLAGQGLVLVYRGSGIINFAQGAMGMVGAFAFYEVRDRRGVPTLVAVAVVLAGSAVLGVVVHLGVIRPLRHAPTVARLLGTLAVLTVLLSVANVRYANDFLPLQPMLPTWTVQPFDGTTMGADRLVVFAFGVVVTFALALFMRVSRFGLATAAVAESEQTAATFGVSPDRVAMLNWALAAMLASAAAILTASLSGLVSASALVLLVLPGLAAALVGGFRSFLLTGVGAIAIGVTESLLTRYVTTPGAAKAVPFLIIIVVLMARGRALPLRDEVVDRPPMLGAGLVRPTVFLPVLVAALLLAWGASPDWVDALTTTCVVCLITLSLVVVTGMGGQVSLAQYAIAGTSAWMSARAVANYDLSFPVAALLGIAAAVPLGILVGIPALRARGVNLAVATLGLALALEQLLFGNVERTGGTLGTNVGVPSLFGIEFDNVAHPERYATLALVVVAVAALGVANLRRGRAGRRLVAVRANERAAASLGINVLGAKLYAFCVASVIAAMGGVLLAFRNPFVRFESFSVLHSVYVTMYAVIGGIGFISGAVLGALLSPGTLIQRLLDEVFGGGVGIVRALAIAGSAIGLLTLLQHPNGVAAFVHALWTQHHPRPRTAVPEFDRPVIPLRTEPAVLDVRDLSVRFGGVTALDRVSITVTPGEVVGLIGPNGSGKTTLIDAVTGFVPSSGDVRVNGRDIAVMGAAHRARLGIARTFQSLELFESMTIADNLRVAADRRDWAAYATGLVHPGRDGSPPPMLAAIDEFGLADDLDRLPDELPFGRRRLAAIARAIAANPSILLLDEPAAGLSRTESDELGSLVRKLAENWGMAVLIVEHDVGLVLDVCHSVTVLAQGRVIATGAPSSIRHDQHVVEVFLGEPRREQPIERRVAGEPLGTPVLLEARGVTAGYRSLAAAREIDLEVREGEIVALLGPNGAGKTTTLLTLAGALPSLRGHVRMHDRIAGGPLHQRVQAGLGLVTDDRCLLRELTTAGNLRLAGSDVDEALSIFPELRPLLGRRVGLLSGGEQQILSLARVLTVHPSLLLVDEMSLGLAPMVIVRLFDELRRAADNGLGVLIVEPHVHRALAVADRVYAMNRGRIVLEGPAADFRGREHQLQEAYLPAVNRTHL